MLIHPFLQCLQLKCRSRSIGPRKIVIAGGVSRIGEPILAPIRRTIRERVRVMPVEEVEVIQAQLGDDAGVIGAALWAANYLN